MRPQGALELPVAKPPEYTGPQTGTMLQFCIGSMIWRPLLCLGHTEDGLVIGTLFLYAHEDRRAPWVLVSARNLPPIETSLPPFLMHVVGAREGNLMGEWRYIK